MLINTEVLSFFTLCLVIAAAVPTVLFPIIAVLIYICTTRRTHSENSSILLLNILIPAYKESVELPITVDSVNIALKSFLNTYPTAQINITVALDGSDQPTRDALNRYVEQSNTDSTITILDRAQNLGKWLTVLELAAVPKPGTWCAFVDAGSVWPSDILLKLAPDLLANKYVSIAPGYKPIAAGRLERLSWYIETFLKRVENFAGGPCSVHGATVFYRTDALRLALKDLAGTSWLNDDVVISLMVRSLGRTHYYGNDVYVADNGLQVTKGESGRRKRILEGNLQWIRSLLPLVFLRNPTVAVIALRRVARVFWAYGVLCVTFSLSGIASKFGIQYAFVTAILCLTLPLWNVKIRAAFITSLHSVHLIFRSKSDVSWT